VAPDGAPACLCAIADLAGDQAPACICVVDDDASLRQAMACLLEAEGYRVVLFDSGESLLAAPGADAIDAAVLDVGLGGMDGFALLARLRALPAWNDPPVPVLMFSGQADGAMRARALRCGALALLGKPVDPDLLIGHIGAALRLGPARRPGRHPGRGPP
jgi:DNA-binding response OmpR family regulator